MPFSQPWTGDRCASGIFRASVFLKKLCLCASQAQSYILEANMPNPISGATEYSRNVSIWKTPAAAAAL